LFKKLQIYGLCLLNILLTNEWSLNVTITIRNAEAGDSGRCLELLTALGAATGSGTGSKNSPATKEVFEKLLSGDRGRIIVAEEAGVILGMATVSYNLAVRYGGEYCQLEELIVDPAARGKNVGGQLVQRTVDDASERGCAEYGLYLLESTEHNRPFYAKYGFKVIGTEMRQRL
jgi:ribosomal protein S18 acetylase RimI-like enzyme